jgi:hypothetical protein
LKINTYSPLLCAAHGQERQKLGWLSPFCFIRWKDQDIERLKRGGCYEREKQRGKGKQEGAAEKPQREEKNEEGKEKQVGRTVSMIR